MRAPSAAHERTYSEHTREDIELEFQPPYHKRPKCPCQSCSIVRAYDQWYAQQEAEDAEYEHAAAEARREARNA